MCFVMNDFDSVLKNNDALSINIQTCQIKVAWKHKFSITVLNFVVSS